MPDPTTQRASRLTAQALLNFRLQLARSDFLQRFIYTENGSRFLGSTHKYGVRLGVNVQVRELIDHLCANTCETTSSCLQTFLSRSFLPSLPSEFLTAVDVPMSVPAEHAGDQSRSLASQAIARELPASLPYANYFWELTRQATRSDPSYTVAARTEEFSAFLGHCHRNTMAKARARYPALWNETAGHYVIDSRGTAFAAECVQQLRARRLLQPGTRFLDLGSGIGTMVAAVHYHSSAHATGVEQHRGLTQLAQHLLRKLSKLRPLDPTRATLKTGDAFHPEVIDLSRYDVCYVYSPLGIDMITADAVLERLRVGAVLVANRRPRRFLDRTEQLPEIAGVGAYRKLAS